MIVVKANYFDGKSSKLHEVTVTLSASVLQVAGDTAGVHVFQQQAIKIAPVVGSRSNRVIRLPKNASLEFSQAEFSKIEPELAGSSSNVHSFAGVLESRWHYVLLAVLIFLGTIWWFYAVAVPYMAKQIAFALPVETERSLGEGALKFFDMRLFSPSKLSLEKQQRLQKKFTAMLDPLDEELKYGIRLIFRKAPGIGPNALAFPSGIIVMTDELVNLAANDEELLAVLAHELGHLVKRHSLRTVLQAAALGLLVAAYTGDISTSSTMIAELPVLFAHMSYSRSFETEADDYALKFLQKNNISPLYFAAIMQKLAVFSGQTKKTSDTSFMSTHPAIHSRIERFKKAALKQ